MTPASGDDAHPARAADGQGEHDAQAGGLVECGRVSAYRSPLILTVNTSALTLGAATLGLPATAETSIAWAGGLAAALLISALAGLLPALKAARLSPTEALWTL